MYLTFEKILKKTYANDGWLNEIIKRYFKCCVKKHENIVSYAFSNIWQSHILQTDTALWARKRRPRPGRRVWAAACRTAAPARSAGRTWRSNRRTTPSPRPRRPSSVPPTTMWRSGRKRSLVVPRCTTATGWRRSTGRTLRSPPNCDRPSAHLSSTHTNAYFILYYYYYYYCVQLISHKKCDVITTSSPRGPNHYPRYNLNPNLRSLW